MPARAIAGAALGTLHERRRRIERLLDGDDRRQFLDLNLLTDQRGRPPGRIERFGRNHCHGLTEEARLAVGEQWTIGNRRPEARHRFGQVLGGEDGHHSRHPRGFVAIDLLDRQARGVEMNELDVERSREREIRGVLLRAGHAFTRADARNRLADRVVAHLSTPLEVSTASTIRL